VDLQKLTTKLTTDLALLLLRVTAGLIFIPHGWTKVGGTGGASAFAADMVAYGFPTILGHVAAWAELAGGALLIVGLLTRIDAFLLACTMFVATFVVLLPDALTEVPPGANKLLSVLPGIETPLALFAICLALLLTGGGRFSLDALVAGLFAKKKAAAEAAAVPT
jgi:putative oxidoreductase